MRRQGHKETLVPCVRVGVGKVVQDTCMQVRVDRLPASTCVWRFLWLILHALVVWGPDGQVPESACWTMSGGGNPAGERPSYCWHVRWTHM